MGIAAPLPNNAEVVLSTPVYDSVLQRLFAIGLGLQRTTTVVADDPAAAIVRLEQAIDDLHHTMGVLQAAPGHPLGSLSGEAQVTTT